MYKVLDTGLIVTKKDPIAKVLPVLAIILSVISLLSSIPQSNIPSVFTSIIGISAGILFFYNPKWFQFLIKIWIVLQVVSVSRELYGTLENGMDFVQEIIYFDASQVINFGGAIRLNNLAIGVNLIPIAYVFLLRFSQTSFLIGRKVAIHKFSRDNKLGYDKIDGKIIRKIVLEEENKWLLVKIDQSIRFVGKEYHWVLLKSKEDEVYKKGKKRYISFVRLVENQEKLRDVELSKKDFPMLDWGSVEVL